MMLSDAVTVARRFQRSVRVDTDLESFGALHGFVCQGSSKMALETMTNLMVETGQRAFTWTGPYGGGKSSLVLALCSALNHDFNLRKQAKALLNDVSNLDQAFPIGERGWLIVPVVGRRGNPVEDLREALAQALAADKGGVGVQLEKTDKSGRDVIAWLQKVASIRPDSGVLVVLDEMGKYLEEAAGEEVDVHFFQELAEAAGRSEGRVVVLGILHQAFEQYASRLGRDIQDEWAKVQGRFVDIPIVTAIDEVIDLLGRAIVTDVKHPVSIPVAKAVAEAIRRRRPGSPDDLAERLDACWPLHPVTAALLGPVSRRRFAQNERSTFGFLGSSESEGFQEFLHSVPSTSDKTYDPAKFWDYLRVNLEPAILASPDGHRWAQGADAVERCESRGLPLHIRLAKTIALIDLFRNGSGVFPERTVLYACLNDVSQKQVDQALNDLESWSIIIFRKHMDAWAIYAGSDFDITEAVEASKASSLGLDFNRLARLAELQPLLAKEHYHRTGTLRWFDTALVGLNEIEATVKAFQPQNGSAGQFLLAIPSAEETESEAKEMCLRASLLASDFPIAIGMPRNTWLVRELGNELIALESVRAGQPELEGDQVARREIRARIAAVSAKLEEELRASFNGATWFVRGKAYDPEDDRGLVRLASQLADDTFPDAPTIHSELVNRERPSSNSQAAVRQLLYAMISRPSEEYLGIEGCPAERGLYSTILEVSGLHGRAQDGFCFKTPDGRKPTGNSYKPMWHKAEELLQSTDDLVNLSSLYKLWSAPPFGVRRGILPILSMAFILAHESSMAVYVDDVFLPDLNDYLIDRLLQDASKVSLRYVDQRVDNEQILKELAEVAAEVLGKTPATEPLLVARALVEFVCRLPKWTHRSSTLSKEAQGVRRILLNASDPYKTLFVDLPQVVGSQPNQSVGSKIASALRELDGAYPAMLNDLSERMLSSLGYKGADFGNLKMRAKAISGMKVDLHLEAFVNRIAEFNGCSEDMEAIAGLAIHKPARDWSDMDPNRAALELANLALRFRQVEMLARVQGRDPNLHAVAVAFGTGEVGRTAVRSFEVAEANISEVQKLADKLLSMLKGAGLDNDLMLAALAEAGLRALDITEFEKSKKKITS